MVNMSNEQYAFAARDTANLIDVKHVKKVIILVILEFKSYVLPSYNPFIYINIYFWR